MAGRRCPEWVFNVLLAARKTSWGRALAAIVWLRDSSGHYWERLTWRERREILDLARKSRGRRANLTKREQKRVVALFNAIRRHARQAGLAVGRRSVAAVATTQLPVRRLLQRRYLPGGAPGHPRAASAGVPREACDAPAQHGDIGLHVALEPTVVRRRGGGEP